MNKIIIFLFNTLPDFIINFIFRILMCFFQKNKIQITEKKTDSIHNLIYMDIDHAIGDFTVFIRNLIHENDCNHKYDVLIHKNFYGILEKLHLKNISIIYKTSSLGEHYNYEKDANVDEILSEAAKLKREYNKIYYFSSNFSVDSILFLSQIKYNDLYKMKDVYKRGNRKVFWFNKKFMGLCIYTYIHKKKFRIHDIGNNEMRDCYFADYAYFLLHHQLPVKSLIYIDIWNEFNTEIRPNTVAILVEHYKRGKTLKNAFLVEFLNKHYRGYNVIFFGSGVDLSMLLKKQNIDFEFTNYIDKTNSVLDLFNAMATVEKVIAYDSGILHIATILSKPCTLICNKKHFAVKYRYNAWMNYSRMDHFDAFFFDKKRFN